MGGNPGNLAVAVRLSLPASGAATTSAGKSSEPIKQMASAYNSSTSAAVNRTFEWQAEPIKNDTSTASATLNLLFGQGTAARAQTGLSIASNGQITFASGQTFPGTGTGDGTITGVIAGTDLTGGGTSGDVTLNLDTTKVPLLAAANTFTGNQTVNGNLSATGVVTGSSYQIGGELFAFGSSASGNAFLGCAGNTTTTGTQNAATGSGALSSNTTGGLNAAFGYQALFSNIGNYNTASGLPSAVLTCVGYDCTASADALTNATAMVGACRGRAESLPGVGRHRRPCRQGGHRHDEPVECTHRRARRRPSGQR